MSPSLLSRASSALRAAGIPHALIGATALAAHGVSRSTLDQDLLVTDPRVLARSTWDEFADATVDIRRGEAEDPLAGVVRITAPDERDVDVIVGRHEWQTAALHRATPVVAGDVELPVVSLADLILLKLYAGGSQDRWDIEQLLAAGGSPQVLRDVQQRLEELPARCSNLWTTLTRS